jgi:hypothetical protein
MPIDPLKSPAMTPPSSSPVLVRWTAIFAGVVVALGVMLLLYTLGIAAGLSAVDVETQGRLRHVGIFAGAWGAFVALASLFVGGFVASRSAGSHCASVGSLQGLVVWALTALATTYGLTSFGANLVSGAAAAGGNVLQVSSQALGAVVPDADSLQGIKNLPGVQGLMDRAGDAVRGNLDVDIDYDAALEPINAGLKKAGKPAVSKKMLEDASREVLQRAIKERKLDKAMLVHALEAHTSLSAQDVASLAETFEKKFQAGVQRMEAQVQQAKEQLQQTKEAATQQAVAAAQEVATGMAKAFWGLFTALALGAVAAVGGALTAVTTTKQSY